MSATTVNEPAAKPPLKLNIPRVINIGLAFMAICLFWDTYDTVMPLFLKNFSYFDTAPNAKLLTGIIMAADNVLALVLLPFMGRLSDNFHRFRSPFLRKLGVLGKRMPFIIVGTLLSALALMLLTLGHEAASLPLMLTAAGFLLVFISLYRSPAVALMPDVTPKPLRSPANAVINIMGVLGGISSMLLSMALLNSREVIMPDGTTSTYLDRGASNWLLMGIVAGLMVLALVIMLIKVRENKFLEEKQQLLDLHGITEDIEDLPEEDREQLLKREGGGFKRLQLTRAQLKSLLFLLSSVFFWYMAYNGAKTFFARFYWDYLNEPVFQMPMLVGQGAGFLAFVPASFLASKIGRKKTVLIGVLICAAGFATAAAAVFAIPKSNIGAINNVMYICFLLVGIGWATINVHSYVMSVEMASKHNTGAFTGLYYTFSMSAQILTPILLGAIIDAVDYKYMFVYTLAMMLVAFVTMLFVRHGNTKSGPNAAVSATNDN